MPDIEIPLAPPQQSAESVVRLTVRLVVDALGFMVITPLVLCIIAGLAALADIVIRGFRTFLDDIGGAQNTFISLDIDTRLLVTFSAGALVYLAIAAAVLLVARLRRGPHWRDYIAWKPFRLESIYLALAAAGVIWGIAIGSVIEAWYPDSKNWVAFPHGVAGVLASLILVVALGPLCEELLFRGWLFTALRGRLGSIATIVTTSVLFAIAHWEKTHLYAIAVFPVGLLLGYARERSGSIRATTTFHGIYNLSGWILAAFAGK